MSFATDATVAPKSALTGNASELFVRHFTLGMQTLHPFRAGTTKAAKNATQSPLYRENRSY